MKYYSINFKFLIFVFMILFFVSTVNAESIGNNTIYSTDNLNMNNEDYGVEEIASTLTFTDLNNRVSGGGNISAL